MLRPNACRLAILAAPSLLAACSTPTITGGASIPAGGSVSIQMVGTPEFSLRNDASRPLPVRIGAGTVTTGVSVMPPLTDSLEPGVTRWWTFTEPMTVVIENPTAEAASVAYCVRGSGVNFQSGPAK